MSIVVNCCISRRIIIVMAVDEDIKSCCRSAVFVCWGKLMFVFLMFRGYWINNKYVYADNEISAIVGVWLRIEKGEGIFLGVIFWKS